MSFWEKHKIYIIIIISLIVVGTIILILHLSSNRVITYVEDDEDINFLKNYQVNEFIPVYITEDQMARIYFNDYINKMLYNKSEAYELLADDVKRNTYPTLQDYTEAVRSLEERASGFVFANYSVETKDTNKIYYIQDNNNNSYVFDVTAVMVYSVRFYAG